MTAQTTVQTTPLPTENRVLPWQWLARQIDAAAYCPAADPSALAERVDDGDESYYVLKNPAAGNYLKLDEADYDLWQLMDGTRTVKELVVAHFVKHKTFAYGRIAALVQELKENHFLTDKPVGLYRQAAQQLEEKDWTHRWAELARAFIEHTFPVKGIDGYVTAIYRWGGWLFFNPLVLALMWIVALTGLIPFVLQLRQPEQFPIVGVLGGGYLEGIILLLLANTVIIFIHELAHALTTKHYGRDVPSGGAMIYYGLPAFYVNTMDIWLEPKKHRIAVSWAGPFSGIVLGGLFSALAWLNPASLTSQFLFKMAFLGYIGCLVNLNPLLELDGYFILVDALGIPMLRQRAFHFIKRELPGKLKAILSNPDSAEDKATAEKEALFTREELLFTVFGLLAAIYTVYVIWFVLSLLHSRVTAFLLDLWMDSGWPGKALVVVLGLAILVPVALAAGVTLWKGAAGAFRWLYKRNFFEREQNIALLSLLGLVISVGLPLLFQQWRAPVLATWTTLLALTAVWSLLLTARQYAGAEIQAMFWALLASAGLLTVGVAFMAFKRPAQALVFTHLAVFPLPVVGIANTLNDDLRRNTRLEKILLLLFPLPGFIGGVLLARWAVTLTEAFLAAGAFFSFFVFLAFIPSLLAAYAHTRFITPWVLLMLGAALLGLFNALSLFEPSVALPWILLAAISFWAVGGGVYLSAGWRLSFPTPSWERGFTISAEQRLKHAFARFFEALFEGFRLAFGDRRAQSVDDDLDIIAVTADWDVELDRGRVRDELNLKEITILEQADRYREVLSRAIDLMDNWAGSKFITRAAQAAYDGLPWPEREVLGRYVLSGTIWGGAIAHQFASARGEQFRMLRSVPLFAGFSNEMLDQLLGVARRSNVASGTIFVKEGQPYANFVLVMGGEVEVWKIDDSSGYSVMVGELKRGAVFGSQVFLPDAENEAQATYRAAVPTDVLLINRVSALKLAEQGLVLNREATTASRLSQMLAEMPLFAELSPHQIEALIRQMGRQSVSKGQVIVQQGQPRQYFYVIQSGEVGVLARDNKDTQKMVAKLGRGEHFGETSLFTNQPYSATCVALSQVELLTLDEFTFDRLIATSHQMTHYVEQVSSGRLKDMRRKLGRLTVKNE